MFIFVAHIFIVMFLGATFSKYYDEKPTGKPVEGAWVGEGADMEVVKEMAEKGDYEGAVRRAMESEGYRVDSEGWVRQSLRNV